MKTRVKRVRKPSPTSVQQDVVYNVRTHGITQSLLGKWLACRESAKQYLNGVTPVQVKDAMTAGSIYHDALETLYNAVRASASPTNIEEIVESIINGFDEGLPTTASAQEIEKLEATYAMVEAVLPVYVQHWLEDFTGGVDWVKVEEVFRVPAPGVDGVSLTGKIDGAFTRGPKSLWLFETKTKAQIQGATMDDALPLDMQVQFYLYALAQVTGRKPRGVLYNVIRRPQLRQKKAESPAEFFARVRDDVKARPDHYFHRWEVPVSLDEMRQFEKALSSIVQEFVAWCDGELATYRNGNACLRPWVCSYLPLCSTGNRSGYYVRENIFQELTV